MSTFARVDSLPALMQFRASLIKFAEVAALSVEEVGMDLQRVETWIQQDRKHYWAVELRTSTEQHTQAKLALSGRQIFERAVQGVPTSCMDERKALKKAEARLAEVQRRVGLLKSWTIKVDRQRNEYRSRVKGLAGAIQADIPKAIAALDRMVISLEAYLALAPPSTPVDTTLQSQDKEGVLWAEGQAGPDAGEQGPPEKTGGGAP